MNNNDIKKKMCRSSPDNPDIQMDRKYITGIPFVAPYNIFTAPVHLDVGGRIYTTTLETLTAVPQSRLAKMFNGELPVVIDKLKQHYFIDRDGDIFRHILNYLRYKSVILPSDFNNYELLYNEALYFKLDDMATTLNEMQNDINKECCKSIRRKRIIVEIEHKSDEERDAKGKRLI